MAYVPQDISRDKEVPNTTAIGGKNLLKPVKNSILETARHNLFPEFVLLRGQKVKSGEIERIAEATNLDRGRIELIPEVGDIYSLPRLFEQGKTFQRLLNRLNVKRRECEKDHIDRYLQDRANASKSVKIFIVGETESWDSFISLNEALKHSAVSLGYKPIIKWHKELDSIEDCGGVIITEGLEKIGKKIEITQICYKMKKPLLAISAGAQIVFATLEGQTDVHKLRRMLINGGSPFIKTKLFTGVRDSEIEETSALYRIIKNGREIGRHRHDIEIDCRKARITKIGARYGNFVDTFEYLEDNCWVFGITAHPEYVSRPGKPNKIISEFLERCTENR